MSICCAKFGFLRVVFYIVIFVLNALTYEVAAIEIQADSVLFDVKYGEKDVKQQVSGDKSHNTPDQVRFKVAQSRGNAGDFESGRNVVSGNQKPETADFFSISQPIFSEQTNIDRHTETRFGSRVVEVGAEQYAYANMPISYGNMMDEVRLKLGDEIYSKLIWTYYDFKDLDDSIYSNIAEFDLKTRNLLGRFSLLTSIDDQLNSMVIFRNQGGGIGKNGTNNRVDHKSGQTEKDKVVLNLSGQNLEMNETVNSGKLYNFFRYINLKSIFFVLLVVMAVGMMWRVFRFFIKQDLS